MTQTINSVVLANIWEYNRQPMTKTFTPREIDAWATASSDLADIALFWAGDGTLVITPEPIDQALVADVVEILGYRRLASVSPRTRTGFLCSDVLSDEAVFEQIVDILEAAPQPRLLAWGPTPQFYDLSNRLSESCPGIVTPALPPSDRLWLARYLDTKPGFREVFERLRLSHPEIQIPDGFVLSDKELAIEAISYFINRNLGFVLKAAHGTAGFSMLSTPDASASSDASRLPNLLRQRMRFDQFWDVGAIVTEAYVHGPERQAKQAPTIDFEIDNSGEVIFHGSGEMLMRQGQYYGGLTCGVGALESDLESRLKGIGRVVGDALCELGYIGWFDLDFVIDGNRNPVVTELNARRTSPAHVFEIAETLCGSNWQADCAMFANDHLPLQGSKHPKYSNLREVFLAFNREHRRHNVLAVPTIASGSLRRQAPWLGYAVMADDSANAARYAGLLEILLRESIDMAQPQEVLPNG